MGIWKTIKLPYQAFFCEKKNGDTEKTFSSKKFWAFCFCVLAFIDKAELILHPASHYSAMLAQKGVTDGVVIAIIASLDVLAVGALGVYGWAKSKNAS